MRNVLLSQIASKLLVDDIKEMPHNVMNFYLDNQRVNIKATDMGLGVFVGDDTYYFSLEEIEEKINNTKNIISNYLEIKQNIITFIANLLKHEILNKLPFVDDLIALNSNNEESLIDILVHKINIVGLEKIIKHKKLYWYISKDSNDLSIHLDTKSDVEAINIIILHNTLIKIDKKYKKQSNEYLDFIKDYITVS